MCGISRSFGNCVLLCRFDRIVRSRTRAPCQKAWFHYVFFFLGCGGNYHKKCAYKIPNNCSDSRHRASTNISGINSIPHSHTLPRPSSQIGGLGDSLLLQQSNSLSDSIPSLKDRRATWGGRPVWIEPALSGRIQVPHTFAIHSYKKPTVCQICKRLVSAVHWKTTFTHSCE